MNLKSGYPFWLVKNGLPHTYPKLEHTLKADVLILGGGISGALTAFYLSEAGIKTAVIDARTIGLGSTCASTSLLQYEIDTPLCRLTGMIGEKEAARSYELCAEAISVIGDIAKKIGYKEFENRKSLYYAAYRKDLAFLKEEFEIRKKYGFPVEFLEPEGIKKDYAFEAPGAIRSSCGAQLNAYTFTHALLQYCIQKHGMEVYDRTAAVKIDHQKTGVKVLTENGQHISANKMVYATGYEVVNLISKKIVDLKTTYATISEQSNDKPLFGKEQALIWNTDDPYLYMRATPDNRILVGGRDEDFVNTSRRDHLIAGKTRKLVKDFNKLYPEVEFKPEFSWSGTFGSTKDGLPFIGTYKALPNSLFALGFGGNGITFSQIAAALLTDFVKGKKNKDLDLFSFGRV